ncbi:MAG: PPC domain-containing protein [Clostridiales bacterium]|nr:PPC domain-containing protein [Clostridiales bacterium]
MTKKGMAILTGLSLLLLAGITAFLFLHKQVSFTGSRVKNPDAYLLDIEKMNGTDLHTLALREGDNLQIQFDTEKGSLYMEIKAPDGTTIYRGNGKETTDFTVNIRESGVYTVTVEARRAKGTIRIQLKEETT